MTAPSWTQKMVAEALEEAQHRARKKRLEFARYRTNPVGFGEDMFGDRYTDDVKALMRSVAENPITVARSANAVGKSQPIETPVLTPIGYIPIGEIVVGNQVIGVDGKPTNVTGVFPQGLQPTYRITFVDKTSTLCSEDHLWATRSSSGKYRGRPWSVMTTRELKRILHRTMHIPVCDPVDIRARMLMIDPYVMGVLLGDGCLGQTARFDSADEFIVKEVKRRVPFSVNWYRKTHYGIVDHPGKPNRFVGFLRTYGLLEKGADEKFVPDDYMLGSIQQRKELLAGLLDTDGCIGRDNHAIEFATISAVLAHQVAELVYSLGGTASITKKLPHYKHNGEERVGQLCYRVFIKTPFCPFMLPRKAERWKDPKESFKQVHRTITSIEYVGEMESVCIRVENPDGLYLTSHCIVTHNTHCAGRIATWFYLTFPDSQVYATAAPPLENLKNLLWGEILSVYHQRMELFGNDRTNTLQISRSPRSFVTGVAIPTTGTPEERQAKFSGKHAPNLLFIVDEGDAVPEEVYKGIEGCMSGGNARLLIMFNPKASRGPVYDLEKMSRAKVVHLSALRHPNVITGHDIIPGAVTRETVVRRINEWTRPLVEGETPGMLERFEVPDFLVGSIAHSLSGSPYPPLAPGLRVIEEPGFYYMVLGIYPAQSANQLISQEWIDLARSRYDAYVAVHGEKPPDGIAPRLGLDVSEYGPDWNVPILRYGSFVARVPRIWQGVDPTATAEKGAHLCDRYGVDVVIVDATGVGSGVAPGMAKIRKGTRCISAKFAAKPGNWSRTELGEFYDLRTQLWWAVREWLRTDPQAMLPPEPQLLQELIVPTYEVQGKFVRLMDKDTMREYLKRSPNFGDALALTFLPADRARVVRLG